MRFTRNLAKVFDVSASDAHVALVVYAEETETVFNLTKHLSYQQLQRAISGAQYPNKKKRNVGGGLRRVDNILASGGRQGRLVLDIISSASFLSMLSGLRV